MAKISKIIKIPEIDMPTVCDTPLSIKVCNIIHTQVHYHNSFIELVYCLKGSVNIRCNQELIRLNAGDIYSFGTEDLHCLYSDSENIIAIIHIDVRKIGISLDTIRSSYFVIENNKPEPYQVAPLREIKNLLLASIYTFVKTDALPQKQINFATHKILQLLLKYFDWNSNFNLSENIDNELRQRLRSVVKYCGTNYMNKLTISQIASELHINENYLSQFMKKSGYNSFSELVGYLRCFYAQFLLLSGELSVMQIADKVGFSDVKYFYKYFKKMWGQTPTEFRHWFADYLKHEDNVTLYSKSELLPIIKDYIVDDFSYSTLDYK